MYLQCLPPAKLHTGVAANAFHSWGCWQRSQDSHKVQHLSPQPNTCTRHPCDNRNFADVFKIHKIKNRDQQWSSAGVRDVECNRKGTGKTTMTNSVGKAAIHGWYSKKNCRTQCKTQGHGQERAVKGIHTTHDRIGWAKTLQRSIKPMRAKTLHILSYNQNQRSIK